MLVVGSRTTNGRAWAPVLTRPAGFVLLLPACLFVRRDTVDFVRTLDGIASFGSPIPGHRASDRIVRKSQTWFVTKVTVLIVPVS